MEPSSSAELERHPSLTQGRILQAVTPSIEFEFEVACVINGRNLGDAVIQNRSIERLLHSKLAGRIVVWTRASSVDAYTKHPRITIVCSPFPVGTEQKFGIKEWVDFLRAAFRIRKLRPDVTIDFFGDFREALFAKLIGSRLYFHANWAADHIYRRTLRYGEIQTNPRNIVIPAREINVYRGHEIFIDGLLSDRRDVASPCELVAWRSSALRNVGLHPFASQACKRWPEANWLRLAQNILSRGLQVTVFGAPNDRQHISRIFASIIDNVTICVGRLSDFFEEVKKVDVLIGLDSLGVHVAERVGVRSIMLAGSNHKGLWAPPHSVSIGGGGGCKHYPCFNRPVCRGSAEEFVCIKSVQVKEIEDTLMDMTTIEGR